MQTLPFGTWPSLISEKTLTENALRFTEIATDQNKLYWLEGRPEEKGRAALMTEEGEISSSTANIRSRVHEYGGGAFAALHGQIIYYNDTDKCVYKDNRALTTPEMGRFADFCIDIERECIYAVREISQTNTLARIDFNGTVTDIQSGADFYSSPVLCGNMLAWITWNHPNMPWENTSLWKWDFKSKPACVKKNASIQGPFWASNLHFISDEGGYWNLYTQDGPVFTAKADLGYPPWILGIKRTALFQGKIAYIRTENGVDSIAIFDPVSQKNTQLPLPFTAISAIAASESFIYAIAATPRKPSAIVKINPLTLTIETIRQSQPSHLPDECISLPVPISFTNRSSDLVHLFFYPPTNPHYCGPEAEKPPLILRCHGGPTAHAMPAFNLEVQYWTSRGFAFADLNYGGSSGYGKAYRERLNGNWGIVDVHDTLDAAEYLASKGLVDAKRMVVKGSSAGGYTALAAITFGQTFAAAVSLYGIADLEALTHTTHKFESHYNDTLIGPYPQSKHLYQDRSPIHHLDKIHRPVLLLQGTEDKIVPPAQAQMLYDALTKKGIPCIYHLFEGEGHGFRNASTIQKAIELENNFYMQLFNITDTHR